MKKRKKRDRIIEKIRRQFPGLKWRYEWPSIWKNDAGWEIQAFSQFTPCSDMCDDCFTSVYIRSDTGQESRWLGELTFWM